MTDDDVIVQFFEHGPLMVPARAAGLVILEQHERIQELEALLAAALEKLSTSRSVAEGVEP